MTSALRTAAPLALLAALAACDPIEPGIHHAVLTDLAAVEHGPAGFVAVGSSFHVDDDHVRVGSDSAAIRRSSAGSAWAGPTVSVAGGLADLAYGGGAWVAVGYGPRGGEAGFILRSTDGAVWSRVTAPALRWRSVAYQNGRFVAIGYRASSDREVMAVSVDGRSWQTGAETQLLSPRLVAGNGLFVLWGEAGWIGLSENGTSWNVTDFVPLNRITALTYRDGLWLGFGVYDCCFGERPDRIEYYRFRGNDLGEWILEPLVQRTMVFSLAGNGETWVAVTSEGLARSPAAASWEPIPGFDDPTRPVLDVSWGGGRFVAVGRDAAWWSEDGDLWTEATLD